MKTNIKWTKLTTNFTEAQLDWAKQHDWFITGNGEAIVGRDTAFKSDDERHYATFTNMKALRDWAGY